MKRKDPSAVATWILEHLCPGGRNDALAGDLLEEFRQGRSSLWYWRQVLAAIAVGWAKALRANSMAFLFALLWALPATAFWIAVIRWQADTFLSRRWDLPWPYSMMCEIGLTFGWQVLYVWAGVIFGFLIFSVAKRRLKVARLVRGAWISLAVYVLAFAALFVWRLLFPTMFDIRYVTAAHLIISFSMIAFRMMFFIAVVAGLWSACASADSRRMRTIG